MNQTYICNYCSREIDYLSQLMHEIVCNQNNATMFFCTKCQLHLNRNEETDHLIGHQMEEYSNLNSSNFVNNSMFYSESNNNPYSLNNLLAMDNNNNNNIEMQYNQPNEATEFCIQDLEKIPHDKKYCVICLVEYVLNDKVKILPCIHIFHSNCIDKWFLNKAKCPLCKTKVKPNNGVNIRHNQMNNNENQYNNLNNDESESDSDDHNYNDGNSHSDSNDDVANGNNNADADVDLSLEDDSD